MGYHLGRQTRSNTRHNATRASVRTVLLADQVRAASEAASEAAATPPRRVVSFCNFVTIWHVSRDEDDEDEDEDDLFEDDFGRDFKFPIKCTKPAALARNPRWLLRLLHGNTIGTATSVLTSAQLEQPPPQQQRPPQPPPSPPPTPSDCS